MGRFGYARVSTTDQDLTSQVDRLKEAGCSPVRAEKASGKAREGRDELACLMEFLRPGDELVVVKLDRLGRSTRDILNLVHEFGEKGAYLTVLEPAFSTKDQLAPILITVLGMVAETERGFILERQKAGIELAKGRGAYKGRKPTVSSERVHQLKAEGLGASAIAKELGISRVHVYRLLKPSGESVNVL